MLRVDGEPAPQGSKNVGRYGGIYEKSKKVGPWRDAIKAAAAMATWEPVTGPVVVGIVFWLRRPASHYRAGRNCHLLRASAPAVPVTRPDIDKLLRSTLDGLTGAGIYADDGQVSGLDVHRRYADPHAGQKPGADITIWEWKEADL